ncbi:hypothetical protein ABVK25_001967 [Lepraria finkii]|uniref:Uncharacterized protein n=1 Tax=Lepraria finkii TaxID=1340010 RepID=A0ABR4BIC9_9LECA
MENEAATGGLEAAYDIVTASGTIHASLNILQKLRNLRKNLKIGGKLILLELIEGKRSDSRYDLRMAKIP